MFKKREENIKVKSEVDDPREKKGWRWFVNEHRNFNNYFN